MQNTHTLKARWNQLREQQPKLRIRDAAQQLQVSELDLLALGCGETCTRLQADFPALLQQLHTLGEVMALTRSNACVHEVHGQFGELHQKGNTALFFRPGQDTRYFLDHWSYAYAVNENQRFSLQFFDATGLALHKIYLTEHSYQAAYEQLIETFRHKDQSCQVEVQTADSLTTAPIYTGEIDPSALRLAWSKLHDVHEANQLIRQYHNDRSAVYQALGEAYARCLSSNTVEALLQQLAEQQIPFILFGMNAAAVQSYSGTIQKLLQTGPWFNVLDPTFNLHLRTDEIAEVWWVRKPSQDGWLHSLDVLDQQGQEIMVMTDQRKRGEAESANWTQLLQQLSTV